METFCKGDRVLVSAQAIGFGEPAYGVVNEVTEFFGNLVVDVKYDKPAPDGRLGISVTNLGLIEKVKS